MTKPNRQERIRLFLLENGPAPSGVIRQAVDLSHEDIGAALKNLIRQGDVVKVGNIPRPHGYGRGTMNVYGLTSSPKACRTKKSKKPLAERPDDPLVTDPVIKRQVPAREASRDPVLRALAARPDLLLCWMGEQA